MELISTIQRDDIFLSRYFDHQVAYRYLFCLSDGHTIEAGVYQHFLNNLPVGLAVEISTMIGCPMRCKFCASASIPFVRSLTSEEMISLITQIIMVQQISIFPKLTMAFQGIGEPSLIPEKILDVSRQLLDVDPRFVISISTTGARLDSLRLWRESGLQFDNLQISCCGTSKAQTTWMMPGSPSLDEMAAEATLCAHSPAFKRVRCNYILVQGFNDSPSDIDRLVTNFSNTSVTIRISALNPTIASEQNKLVPANSTCAQEFCSTLKSRGLDSFVFGSFNSTNVSCGQLTFLSKKPKDER